MVDLRCIWALFLTIVLLQVLFEKASSIDADDQNDSEVIETINNSANYFVKFVLQHFTAEYGMDGQSANLLKITRYWSSFGYGIVPIKYQRDDGLTLFRVMNSWLTKKATFLFQKPIADYNTRVVRLRSSGKSVLYRALVKAWFQNCLDLEHLQINTNELAKQTNKTNFRLSHHAAPVHIAREKSVFKQTIRDAFADKMRQLFNEMYQLGESFIRLGQCTPLCPTNPEHIKMYLQELYRLSTQCGHISVTPDQFGTTLDSQFNEDKNFFNLALYKNEWNFRQMAKERGDLLFRPIPNLKSRTVRDASVPPWFRKFWLVASDESEPQARFIPVCTLMKLYIRKGLQRSHEMYERNVAKAALLVAMKPWVEPQLQLMQIAQKLIDGQVNRLVNPSSAQMNKRMEQCYLRSVLSAWNAQIGHFKRQLFLNRPVALASARRYLVSMDLWPNNAGERTKAFEQLFNKQLPTGQQVKLQAMVKIVKPELAQYIPSKSATVITQLEAIKNSYDETQFAKAQSSIKSNLKATNQWLYYRIRLAVYLAFLKPCSNAPSSMKQLFYKSPLGRGNFAPKN